MTKAAVVNSHIEKWYKFETLINLLCLGLSLETLIIIHKYDMLRSEIENAQHVTLEHGTQIEIDARKKNHLIFLN